MTDFSKFRKFQTLYSQGSSDTQKEFLTKSKSSRTVFHIPVNEERTAVMTNSYKEGGDEFIMFTETLADNNDNVCVGDYIESDNTSYLVYSEYNHPMKHLWIKNRLLECNQVISFDMLEQPVYYVSSLRRFVNNELDSSSNMLAISSGAKPMMITRDNSELTVGMRFMIIDELFSIVEIDRMSNSGIAYMSIEPTTTMSQDDVDSGTAYEYPTPEVITEGQEGIPGIVEGQESGGRILAGSKVIEATVGGFIQFDSTVKVLSKTSTEVVWQAPMREELIMVTVIDNQTLLEKEIFYKVVI